MGGKSSAPPAPDYSAAAQQQGQANLQSAIATNIMNRPTEVTPYGTRTWTQTGTSKLDNLTGFPAMEVPEYTSSIQFTPEGQALFDRENAMKMGLANLGVNSLDTVQNVMGQKFKFGGPEVQTSVPGQQYRTSFDQVPLNTDAGQSSSLDLSGNAKMPINAGTTALQAAMARLQPTLERQRSQLDTQLVNQGLRQGTEAYRNAMTEQGQRENDLYNQAVASSLGLDMQANQQGFNQALQQGQFGNQANLAGAQFENAARQAQFGQNQSAAQFENAARQAQFGQDLQSAGFGNQAQQQAYQQALYERNLPLNEITALMSGSQVQAPNFQNFYTGAQVAPAPIFGATQAQGQYDMNTYNQQIAQQNALMGGLAQLGGMGLYGFGAGGGFK